MLFKYNGQQWFNTDCIETIDDYTYDLDVTLKSGRKCRVNGSSRDLFFACIKIPADENPQWTSEEILRFNADASGPLRENRLMPLVTASTDWHPDVDA